MDAVPTKGSRIRAPGTAPARFAIINARAVSSEVGPR